MVFDPTERPSADSIVKEEEYHLKVWEKAFNAIERAYSFYTLSYNIWEHLAKENKRLAESLPVVRSGQGRSLIDHFVDANLAMDPHFHRPRVGKGEEAKLADERVEKALQEVFKDAGLNPMAISTKVNAKQLAIMNYTQLYAGLDPDATTERPTRKEGEDLEDFQLREWVWETQRYSRNPFVIRVPQPGEVLMDPTRKHPMSAVARQRIKAYDLLDIVKTKKGKKGRFVADDFAMPEEAYDEIDCLEHWTPFWHTVMRREGGQVIYTERNGWGIQPYLHTFGGDADMPYGTRENAGFDPVHYIEQALLFPAMDYIVLNDQRMVGLHGILMQKFMARRITALNAADAANQLRGTILGDSKKDDWAIEETPDFPANMQSYGSELAQDITMSTYDPVMAGYQTTKVDTATQAIMAAERADRMSAADVAQMGRLYSVAASNVLKLAHRLHTEYGMDTIDVGEHPLRHADIGGRFSIEATFPQVDIVTLMQQKQDAREDLAIGAIDMERYRTIGRYEDPASLERGVERDKARAMPEVAQENARIALRELGYGKLADRMEAEAKMAQATGLVGPNGQPISTKKPATGGAAAMPPVGPQEPMEPPMMPQGGV